MSRRRYELTDFEWSIIKPLLPNKPRGVPRVDDRRVLNGILWRFRTGLDSGTKCNTQLCWGCNGTDLQSHRTE